MKVLQATIEDLAGTAISLQHAINQHTSHECRSIRRDDNYIGYEGDIEPPHNALATWQEWFSWADVVHIHEYPMVYKMLTEACGFTEKPVVWSIHGTYYRRHHADIDAILTKHSIPAFASTPDLLLLSDATLLPIPVAVGELNPYRQPNGQKLVVQTRTSPLKGELPDLPEEASTDVVEQVTHKEALERKGKAWLVVDQIGPHALGLGVSGVEAMAMGIPVLSGAPDDLLVHLRRTWGELPFMPTTPEELPLHVETLLREPTLWQHWSERGLAHVSKWNDPKAVAELAVERYEEVLDAQA